MEFELIYREYKPLLFSIAYRMLGSVADAEDMVQETFAAVMPDISHGAVLPVAVQVSDVPASPAPEHASDVPASPVREQVSDYPVTIERRKVDNWKAYLCRAVTNRCMDVLKSARKKRELYVGPWLPEPLVQHAVPLGADPLESTILEETVSYAFLVLLERLTPIERAVFILREAFDYAYSDIAEIVGKTELGCRQIYSRVRRKVQAEPGMAPVDLGTSRALVERFLHAATTGDMGGLITLLSEDAVLISDGGGKRRAAIHPIVGSERVAAFLAGLAAKAGAEMAVRTAIVNGVLGLVVDALDGPTVVTFVPAEDGRCSRIYLVRNPDKLTTLPMHLRLSNESGGSR